MDEPRFHPHLTGRDNLRLLAAAREAKTDTLMKGVPFGIKDIFDDSPVEIVLTVEPVFDGTADHHQSLAWCRRLTAMYRAWADKRRMQFSAIAERTNEAPIVLISGFGAFALFCFTLAIALPRLGTGASFALATALALLMQSALIALARARAAAPVLPEP